MVPKIKFCGLTSVDDAERAVRAGAWAIGVIMWPDSDRYCDLATAAEIGATVKRRVELAGVFVNPTLDHVVGSAEAAGLTMVQLHGDEGPAFCSEVARRTGCRVIKAIRVRGRADLQALAPFHTDFHLLDSYVSGKRGGTGATFAWETARAHRGSVPVVLSGGLTPENVAAAIDIVRPYAVDVASGVELSPGRKDPAKLEAFTAAVHASVAEAAAAEDPLAQPVQVSPQG